MIMGVDVNLDRDGDRNCLFFCFLQRAGHFQRMNPILALARGLQGTCGTDYDSLMVLLTVYIGFSIGLVKDPIRKHVQCCSVLRSRAGSMSGE